MKPPIDRSRRHQKYILLNLKRKLEKEPKNLNFHCSYSKLCDCQIINIFIALWNQTNKFHQDSWHCSLATIVGITRFSQDLRRIRSENLLPKNDTMNLWAVVLFFHFVPNCCTKWAQNRKSHWLPWCSCGFNKFHHVIEFYNFWWNLWVHFDDSIDSRLLFACNILSKNTKNEHFQL